MDFEIIRIILIAVTLIISALLLRRYQDIPSLSLTLLCFISFQIAMREWYDLLFLIGIGSILAAINLEYINLYNKLKESGSKRG